MVEMTSAPATASLERHISPVDIPSTEFPDPETEQPQSNRGRVGSDNTLCEETQDTLQKRESAVTPLPEIKRPHMNKYATEVGHSVSDPFPIDPIKRCATEGEGRFPPSRNLFEDEDTDYSDESSISDQEFEDQHQERPVAQPEHHNPLSPRELNRTRSHPQKRVGDSIHRGNNRLRVGNDYFQSHGRVARDGRLNISVNETANSGYLAKALGATIEKHLAPQSEHEKLLAEKARADFYQKKDTLRIPRLNIVIMVIGSRGDIQPFLKIGKILQDKYHHRVRIATHPTFKKFVEEDIGLEFFSIGGDPSELMAFMVKNPGLIPSVETVVAGEISRRRDSMFEMFQGFWRACINATDDEKDIQNLKMLDTKHPFVADAIIANPPSFAHYHCAERLGIPLHLVFTFPYSPTTAFPHPLANIKSTNVDQNYTNYMSYPLVDLMTWQGLGDLVNRFRVKTLGLEAVSTLWAPGQLSRLKVPMTYLWSPSLVPKPADWGPEIDIAGYVFLDLASSFKPPEDLTRFLDRSEDDRPLIYVGFGSIAGIDDPVAFTRMVFEGIEKAGVRAVISKGWGGMGEGVDKPDEIFMIDNVPHDWLLPQVDAVVHHGGAGTTAAGLRFGKPTMIVPFFGDQPFWSAMIARAEAGAKKALPLKKLNSDRFAEGIRECLEPAAKAKAEEIAKGIEEEGDGAENAVDSFHRALSLDGKHSMRCGIFPDRVAVWQVKKTCMRLSALAANLLVDNLQLQYSDLTLIRHRNWRDFHGPGEPITAAGGVIVNTFQAALQGLTDISENTRNDFARRDRWKRMKRGMSIADGLVTPGKIAHAIHGRTSIEDRRREMDHLSTNINLHGDAAPIRPSLFGHHETSQSLMASPLQRTTTAMADPGPKAEIVIKNIGRGIGRSAKAFFDLPANFVYATTQGFRNAPRLYGDATVRRPPETITGFRSGIKVAGQELFFGFYDGITGIVRIPYHDVRKDGCSGVPKGIARATGGIVLKPISGMLGIVSYTVRGVRRSIHNRFRDTNKTERWIRRVRMSQGVKDVSDIQERQTNAAMAAGGPFNRRRPRFHRLRRTVTNMMPGTAVEPDTSDRESPTDELAKARTEATTVWTSRQQEMIEEEKQKDNPLSILRPSRSGASSPKTKKEKKLKENDGRLQRATTD